MSGNAHRSRARRKPCDELCKFCRYKPSVARKMKPRPFRNSNGHRHNPAANKKQKGR